MVIKFDLLLLFGILIGFLASDRFFWAQRFPSGFFGVKILYEIRGEAVCIKLVGPES